MGTETQVVLIASLLARVCVLHRQDLPPSIQVRIQKDWDVENGPIKINV